ncbi:MAG: metalloregulator ArsR/SmtB family transcription factor [Gammaproteobacteria bacterium]|nr:metalloregulator ArsR/SmtB family transcription factor [Gammaproteobacteria bacterium]
MSPATDTLSMTFAALSDPTRRAMLARLVQGEASVNELAAPFKMSLPAVSKHIKVLEKAGLLIKTRQAQQRPCKIDGEQLKQAVDWIEQYRQLWEGRLDRLDAYLLELHASESAVRPAQEMVSSPDASKPIDTPAKAKRSAGKQAQLAPSPKKPKPATRSARNQPTAEEKPDDDKLQQQIGFDF